MGLHFLRWGDLDQFYQVTKMIEYEAKMIHKAVENMDDSWYIVNEPECLLKLKCTCGMFEKCSFIGEIALNIINHYSKSIVTCRRALNSWVGTFASCTL